MVSTHRFFIAASMGLSVVQTIALGLTSNGSVRAGASTATALDSFQFAINGYFHYDWIEGSTNVAAPGCENCAQRCLDFGDACIAFGTNGGDCANAAQCNIYTTQYGTGQGFSTAHTQHCRAYLRRVFPTHIVVQGMGVPPGNTISLGAYIGSHQPNRIAAAASLNLQLQQAGWGRTWPMLKFMDIPATCTSFTTATLRIYVTQFSAPFTMYTLTKDWGVWDTYDFELGLPNTWSELGMDDATEGVGTTGVWDASTAVTIPHQAAGWVDVDVTSTVQSWQSGASPNYGWIFEAQAQIVTSFYGPVSYSDPPQLVIDCTLAAETPSSAVGDPHLQNVHRERFDLMKPGKHTLIQIPRSERAESTLLRVDAMARKLGGQCDEIYFTDLNITGSWADAKQAGGYQYTTQSTAYETGEWVAFGSVHVKVVHANTEAGTQYLNFYIKHLGQAGFAVGGLLGEDDHEDVSTPPASCVNHVSLKKPRVQENGRQSFSASVASATLA